MDHDRKDSCKKLIVNRMRQRLRPVFWLCSRAEKRSLTRLQKKEGIEMKILLTEDDDKLRTELALFFKMHGYDTGEITDYKMQWRRSAVQGAIFCF